jgi:hypothetical protein
MATQPCPHPSLLSESQDWYRPRVEPVKTRRIRGYEIKKGRIQHHAKHSYTDKFIAARRRRIYREAVELLLSGNSASALATSQARTEQSLKQKFLEHATKWDRETAYLSSTPKMVLHDSYQKIMAMGPDIVPVLLRDLQENRRSWFWALRHLTHANPVPPEDQGNLDKMIAAWVAWGKREGQI